jgi:hypothetical protein
MKIILLSLMACAAATSAFAATAPMQLPDLQGGQAQSRALATAGIQALRPADPRALNAAAERHRTGKAALTAEEQADLHNFALRVRDNLFGGPLPRSLRAGTVLTIRITVPELTEGEAAVLADYVLAEIAAGSGATARNPQDQLLNATRDMQEVQMAFNVQYLQELRQGAGQLNYTAVSNVMKTKRQPVVTARCLPPGGTTPRPC